MSKVVVANDHGAVELTASIVDFLKAKGFDVNYMGTYTNDSVDYPDIAEAACREFKKGFYEFGVLCCGTGIGISMSANKIKGIRCALPQNCFVAKMAKEHNNANFIAFGGRIEYQQSVLDMLDAYISASPSEEPRHKNRIAKMMRLEELQSV